MTFDGSRSEIWSDEEIQGAVSASDSSYFVKETSILDNWITIDFGLGTLAKLSNDWDGQGAIAPRLECISDATYFLAYLARNGAVAPDRVLPTGDGAILAEWHGNSEYREAEFVGKGKIEWMTQQNPDAPFEHHVTRILRADSEVWAERQETTTSMSQAA